MGIVVVSLAAAGPYRGRHGVGRVPTGKPGPSAFQRTKERPDRTNGCGVLGPRSRTELWPARTGSPPPRGPGRIRFRPWGLEPLLRVCSRGPSSQVAVFSVFGSVQSSRGKKPCPRVYADYGGPATPGAGGMTEVACPPNPRLKAVTFCGGAQCPSKIPIWYFTGTLGPVTDLDGIQPEVWGTRAFRYATGPGGRRAP